MRLADTPSRESFQLCAKTLTVSDLNCELEHSTGHTVCEKLKELT